MSNIGDGTLHTALLQLIDVEVPNNGFEYNLEYHEQWDDVFKALEHEGVMMQVSDIIWVLT